MLVSHKLVGANCSVLFLGVTNAPHMCIITEFLSNGGLDSLLRSDIKKIELALQSKLIKGIAAG